MSLSAVGTAAPARLRDQFLNHLAAKLRKLLEAYNCTKCTPCSTSRSRRRHKAGQERIAEAFHGAAKTSGEDGLFNHLVDRVDANSRASGHVWLLGF